MIAILESSLHYTLYSDEKTARTTAPKKAPGVARRLQLLQGQCSGEWRTEWPTVLSTEWCGVGVLYHVCAYANAGRKT